MDKRDAMLEESRRGLESFGKKERGFDCRRCGAHYEPQDGQWIFYDFCDPCFRRFNEQKMRGRFAHMVEGKLDTKYFESSDEWIAHDSRQKATE